MADKRAQRREARRQEMLDAAMGIVVEKGLDALTIAGIAKRLGAAVGALYRYFSGKEELIVALQRQAVAEVKRQVRARVEELQQTLPATLTPQARAIAVVVGGYRAYIDHAFASPRRHRLVDLFMSAPSSVLSEASAQRIEESVVEILVTVRDLFKECAAVGALEEGDPVVRTYAGWAVIHAMDHFKKRDRMTPHRVRVPQLLPAMYGALLHGWGARWEDIDAAMDALGPIVFPP